jgi:hypothetical protein
VIPTFRAGAVKLASVISRVVSLLEKYTLLRLHALKGCALWPGGNWIGEWRMWEATSCTCGV